MMSEACSQPTNRANILPAEVQYMADTMFSHRRNRIIKEMDTLCMQNSPAMIERARDSLVLLEKARIEKILNRDE